MQWNSNGPASCEEGYECVTSGALLARLGLRPETSALASDSFPAFQAPSQALQAAVPNKHTLTLDAAVSSIIVYPQPGDRLAANTTFNVTIQTRNLRAGFLVNPSSNYYTAPQQLDEKGHIIGHCHVTIQNIGSFRTMEAPDAGSFAFFKGIDDAGDGNGKRT